MQAESAPAPVRQVTCHLKTSTSPPRACPHQLRRIITTPFISCLWAQVKEDLSGLKVIAKVKLPCRRRRPASLPLDALPRTTAPLPRVSPRPSRRRSAARTRTCSTLLISSQVRRPPTPALHTRLEQRCACLFQRAAPPVLMLCRSWPCRRCSHPSWQRPPRPWRLRRCVLKTCVANQSRY